ncbi:archaeosortase A [Methanoplanus limicola]|uniref:Exosortase EpsH-related protein n=1 Tax=Methanoplanus limicola DSM 2279 TaxID=937775 RepID=H1Z1V8_9EURY|nr:archaeosortase A [Methanoplanus limicola]EHQ35425.1 Exosortase EpsH-related protein [Methanoplanus limicola DSM 2279]
MIQTLLASISFAGFLLFLFPGKYKKIFASAGWIFLVASVFANFPEYFSENNIAYPIVAFLSLPVLLITVKKCLAENENIIMLTRGAAIAYLIFAPFAYIPVLGDTLILLNVKMTETVFTALGFTYSLPEWNMFMHDIFRVEIVLGCTGIQAIAIMTGAVFTAKSGIKQKLISVVAVVALIILMNLIRNVFVIISYTKQWFPFLPEIASNGQFGYESYFWAHNIISEFGLSLLTLIAVGYTIILINPKIAIFIKNIADIYYRGLKDLSEEIRR